MAYQTYVSIIAGLCRRVFSLAARLPLPLSDDSSGAADCGHLSASDVLGVLMLEVGIAVHVVSVLSLKRLGVRRRIGRRHLGVCWLGCVGWLVGWFGERPNFKMGETMGEVQKYVQIYRNVCGSNWL